MIEDLPYIQIHPDALYSDFFDDTTPYYNDPNNKINPKQFDEMEQLNREPLNEEEIKIVRQILPSHIPATKLDLKNYVYEREKTLNLKLHDTYREQSRLGDEFNRLRNNGYNTLKDSLRSKQFEIMPIKAELRYYKDYDWGLKIILGELKNKLEELKIKN